MTLFWGDVGTRSRFLRREHDLVESATTRDQALVGGSGRDGPAGQFVTRLWVALAFLLWKARGARGAILVLTK